MLYLKEDFEKLYKLYYPKMFAFAKNYVPANRRCGEYRARCVSYTLGKKGGNRDIFYAYDLSVYIGENRCLNFLRHKLIEEEYNSQMKEELGFKLYALEAFDYSYQSEEELQEIIRRALDTLPERCREIFIKSRIEGLKYKEISDELGISVNTVENQMVTALKKLRVALKDYLPLLLFLVN